jgi:protein-tyrosine phosphatase
MRQEAIAVGSAVGYQRLPIPDYDIPTQAYMRDILDTIDAALEAYHVIYLHCFGGRGRTGTVVGCYLARHGMSGQVALNSIAHWRSDTPDGHFLSPETEAQRRMVMTWPQGC